MKTSEQSVVPTSNLAQLNDWIDYARQRMSMAFLVQDHDEIIRWREQVEEATKELEAAKGSAA